MRDVLVEQLCVERDDVERDSKFIDDLGTESLDIVGIVMMVEETSYVELPDEEVENVSTVQDLVDTLARKYKNGECMIENGERPLEILYSRKRRSYLQG